MPLTGKNILVTGATGFIGGRLAQRLAQDGAIVTGTGRNLAAVPFLREAGVTLQPADITDTTALRQLLAGQDVIFHLAAAMGRSDEAASRRINVAATADLVRLAAEAGVRRFIHTSSIAVYGPPTSPLIAEDHPLDLQQAAPYGRTKAEGEQTARKVAAETGLELVVIRPGMVYGPRGPGWTVNMVRLLQRGFPVIMGDGSGHAQPVYVDNLIDGLILAADPQRTGIAGEAFNFVDRPLPWRDFFGYYGRMSGRKPRRLPLWLARVGLGLYKRVSGRLESTDSLLAYYTSKAVYPIDKAERLLGYRPRLSLDEGMQRTEAWLHEAGYLG